MFSLCNFCFICKKYEENLRLGGMVQVRVSAVLTNAPFFLNLDCDHYINNSKALRESMCFMMDPTIGRKVCYVQFPQRFDGIDLNDRYANRNTVFFDVSWLSFSKNFYCCCLNLQTVLKHYLWFMTDQYERFGWSSRSGVCRHWLCV